jgi:uncharacterized membrane protein
MRWLKLVMRWLLGVAFVLAGVNHFVNPGFYLPFMPPYLPWHLGLIYVSGVFEVALGALLLVPRFAPLAAWGLIALLIAFLPLHVHMAVNSHLFRNVGPAALWARLAFQGVLLAWAYWFTGKEGGAVTSPPST